MDASQKPTMAINVTFGVCAAHLDIYKIKYFIKHS